MSQDQSCHAYLYSFRQILTFCTSVYFPMSNEDSNVIYFVQLSNMKCIMHLTPYINGGIRLKPHFSYPNLSTIYIEISSWSKIILKKAL